MKIVIPVKYRNLINRVNVFQLVGDAHQAKETLNRNIHRIIIFYSKSIPQLKQGDLDELAVALKKFYITANFYRSRRNYSTFIVSDLKKIKNQEWLTIIQFISFLRIMLRESRLQGNDEANQSSLKRLLEASQLIRQKYYSSHAHTVVMLDTLQKVIEHDFA